MTTLTVTIEDDLLQSAQEFASSKGMPLDQLVRELLAELTQRDAVTRKRREAREILQRSFVDQRVEVGNRDWTREELHER